MTMMRFCRETGLDAGRRGPTVATKSVLRLLVLGIPAGISCGGGTTLTSGDADGEVDPWAPPIGDAGEVGWRDSTEPWEPPALPDCELTASSSPLDIWSDSAGVYGLYGWDLLSRTGGGGAGTGGFISVAFNDGSGWTDYSTWRCGDELRARTCGVSHLAGRIREGLVAWGNSAVVLIGPSSVSEPWGIMYDVEDIWVVHEDLAYAYWRGGLIHYNGRTWSVMPAEPPMLGVQLVWADEDDVWLVGQRGRVASLDGDRWVLHDVGTINDFTSIWGFDGDDVWLASGSDLFHYDGTAWSEVTWPNVASGGPCDPLGGYGIGDFWGADGVLFFHTGSYIVRGVGDDFAVIGHWPQTHDGTRCTGGIRVVDIWGNSPTEVFVAAMDPSQVAPSCGPEGSGRAFLLFWDGNSFHWF